MVICPDFLTGLRFVRTCLPGSRILRSWLAGSLVFIAGFCGHWVGILQVLAKINDSPDAVSLHRKSWTGSAQRTITMTMSGEFLSSNTYRHHHDDGRKPPAGCPRSAQIYDVFNTQ